MRPSFADRFRQRNVVTRFAVEVALLGAAWQVYRWGRYLVRDQEVRARANANQIVDLERRLDIAVEPAVQHAIMASRPVIEFLNHYYVYTHVAATVACLAWLFLRHPGHYASCRRVLLTVTGFGLVVHGLYPLAPPRMLVSLGMSDTLAMYGPGVYSRNEFASITNQFAAMPSFHVGWAALCACFVVRCCRSRWRWLTLLHPILMALAVVATANHYFLDAVVGTSLILGGIAIENQLADSNARTGALSRGLVIPST